MFHIYIKIPVHNSFRSTPINFQQFFDMQDTNINNQSFYTIIILPDDGPVRRETCWCW